MRVVAEGDDRFRGATVLHSQAEDVDLVRLWGQRSSWGSAPSGEPIEAADAGDAAYWGLALSMLRGGTLVGPSGPDT